LAEIGLVAVGVAGDPSEPAAAPTESARSPRTIAAVVLAAGPGDAGIHLLRMPAEVLMDLHHAQPRLLVPDPDGPGRRKMLDHALDGFLAAVGPTVSVPEAAKSLRWAQEALGLAQRGVFGDSSIVRCDDHP
jgi:hypothetical protein